MLVHLWRIHLLSALLLGEANECVDALERNPKSGNRFSDKLRDKSEG